MVARKWLIFGVVFAGLLAGYACLAGDSFQEDLLGMPKACPAPTPAAQQNLSDPDLPNDGCPYYSLFFLQDNWQTDPAQRRMVEWFNSSEYLRGLVAKTIRWEIHPTSAASQATPGAPMSPSRHSRIFVACSTDTGRSFADITGGEFPCYILQTCNQDAGFKISRDNMPSSREELEDYVRAAMLKLQQQRAGVPRPVARCGATQVQTIGLFSRLRHPFQNRCNNNTPDAGPVDEAPEPEKAAPAVPDTVPPPAAGPNWNLVYGIDFVLVFVAAYFNDLRRRVNAA